MTLSEIHSLLVGRRYKTVSGFTKRLNTVIQSSFTYNIFISDYGYNVLSEDPLVQSNGSTICSVIQIQRVFSDNGFIEYVFTVDEPIQAKFDKIMNLAFKESLEHGFTPPNYAAWLKHYNFIISATQDVKETNVGSIIGNLNNF